MQIREDQFRGNRPPCPVSGPGCKAKPYHNGNYQRWDSPDGSKKQTIYQFYCPPCKVSITVIPTNTLPYRPLKLESLVLFFDNPSDIARLSVLLVNTLSAAKRAWKRFCSRTDHLAHILGQSICCPKPTPQILWKQIRGLYSQVSEFLNILASKYSISLLGDYPRSLNLR